MKKWILRTIVLISMFVCSSAYGISQTTEQEIRFNNVDWDMPLISYGEEILDLNRDGLSGYTESCYEGFACSFGDDEIIKTESTFYGNSYSLDFEMKSFQVAGYNVSNFVVRSCQPENAVDIVYIYLDSFIMKEGRKVKLDQQDVFNDVLRKLTVLYGKPFTYEENYDYAEVKISNAIWIGDNTGITLQTLIDEDARVCLCYGSLLSKQRIQQIESDGKKAIDDIASDYSGL